MTAVTCGICFGMLTEPVTLQCAHSYCLNCIRAQMEQGNVAEGGFTCPMCNMGHDFHRDDLRSMVNNDLAARVLNLTRGTDNGLTCQWCEEVPATLHCQDCPYVLCQDCNVAVHKNSSKRSHRAVPLQDAKAARSITKKCPIPKHEEYKLDFYCTRCEELCCAYCLQVGPHHLHENVIMTRAANEARQRMGRDLDAMGHTKNRIENQAHDLNRMCAQYQETYDNVESLVTDRFAAFHQQLAQKELEVRSQLQALRESGDTTLASVRQQYLTRLNAVNEAVLQYRRLQHGGADYEVLENRALVSSQLRGDVPQISGGAFRVNDLGDLHVSGLSLALDLSAMHPEAGRNPAHNQSMATAHVNASRTGSEAPKASVARQASLAPHAAQPVPVQLTFSPDRDVAITPMRDGSITMQCTPNASVTQIGIRANEAFDYLRQHTRDLPIQWRIRLDNVGESKIGIVDKSATDEPDGFYWKPMRLGAVDGTAGRPGPGLRDLPQCRRGDVITFVVDPRQRTLSCSVNNADFGVIVNEVPLRYCPCLIFRPGDAFTVLAN